MALTEEEREAVEHGEALWEALGDGVRDAEGLNVWVSVAHGDAEGELDVDMEGQADAV